MTTQLLYHTASQGIRLGELWLAHSAVLWHVLSQEALRRTCVESTTSLLHNMRCSLMLNKQSSTSGNRQAQLWSRQMAWQLAKVSLLPHHQKRLVQLLTICSSTKPSAPQVCSLLQPHFCVSCRRICVSRRRISSDAFSHTQCAYGKENSRRQQSAAPQAVPCHADWVSIMLS